MSACRTDLLHPGDVVEAGEVMTYRTVVDVQYAGDRTMVVTLGPPIIPAENTVQLTVPVTRLWVIRGQ